MTTKTFSQNRMGRNPFAPRVSEAAPKPSTTPRPPRSKPSISAKSGQGSTTFLHFAIELPLRSFVFGLKSLLVMRYLVAHPKEWRLF